MKNAAFLLLLIAGQVAAQPQQEPERKAAQSEPRLNLKLDESDLRALSRNASVPRAPSEEKSADGLPSLGGDARKFDPAPPPSDTRRPYPPDTQIR
jgi:hypothetical protein